MEVTSKTKGEAIVIYLNGELTTTNSPEAQTEINEVLESAKCKLVVINVENVDFIASTGLRIILALGKKLEESGTKLVVCSATANPTNKSVFKMAGFSRLFKIFDTEEEALQLT
jgi:anti-sigma B factor antagonist